MIHVFFLSYGVFSLQFSKYVMVVLTMKLTVKLDEAQSLIEEPPEFPKYSTGIMNLAKQYSQATRPKVVLL